MLTCEKAMGLLRKAGVLQEGHFLLASGRHSDIYLQCAQIFRDPQIGEKLCAGLAAHFDAEKIDLVIGPAIGALQMAYEVSRQLRCENFFTEQVEGRMTLRRGFKIIPGSRVLIVESVVTTGASVREVIELVKAQDGIPAGVGVIVDRSGERVRFPVPMKALLSLSAQSWNAAGCPLCKTGMPLEKPGGVSSFGR